MVVVGFDVGKDTLFGARIDRSGILKERYTLANTRAAVLPVLQQLRSKYKYLTVASEATGDYHRALAQSCVELDITFRLLNPLTVNGISGLVFENGRPMPLMLKQWLMLPTKAKGRSSRALTSLRPSHCFVRV